MAVVVYVGRYICMCPCVDVCGQWTGHHCECQRHHTDQDKQHHGPHLGVYGNESETNRYMKFFERFPLP